MNNISAKCISLFESWSSEKAEKIQALAASGSDRQYFRIWSKQQTVIAVYNENLQENQTFIDYSKHFKDKNIQVPNIYTQDLEKHIYLQEDLGDITLLSYLQEMRKKGDENEAHRYYKKALSQLACIQTQGIKDLAVENYHTRPQFDQQNMLWDLNYFKYCFLKSSKVIYDDFLLDQAFQAFTEYLSEGEQSYFLFRDFQARNIMLKDGEVYFIDYQGGKRGALQYDVASLLFQAKADLSNEVREELLNYYIGCLQEHINIDEQTFRQHYYAFVLMRCLQVLGAYGFKGYVEKKEHFISSIPFALKNLKWLLNNCNLPGSLDYLNKILQELLKQEEHKQAKKQGLKAGLNIRVQSFSYKIGGVPQDPSGNGGGFVFDCRYLNNPGRYQPYKKLTGRDQSVIDFLESESNIQQFLEDIYQLVDPAVERYLERGFTHLSINFGCTGGQHRSVYSADAMAKHLSEKYEVNVLLNHIEQERKNWIN